MVATPSASPQRLGVSRSTPSLSASYSLRQYSLDRKRLLPQRPSSSQAISYEAIDLIGGNGKWRQRKAQLDFDEKEVQAKEQRRQQEILDEQRRQRREQREAARKHRMEEEKKQMQELQEKKRREQKARQDEERRQEEAEAQKKAKEMRLWQARQPTTCMTCAGSGKCSHCSGKGTTFSVFLTSKVTNNTNMDFGRAIQGCEECGGCNVNIMGELKPGSGKCAKCFGHGKIWPAKETLPSDHGPSPTGRRRTRLSVNAMAYLAVALGGCGGGSPDPMSPKDPDSPGSPVDMWGAGRMQPITESS